MAAPNKSQAGKMVLLVLGTLISGGGAGVAASMSNEHRISTLEADQTNMEKRLDSIDQHITNLDAKMDSKFDKLMERLAK